MRKDRNSVVAVGVMGNGRAIDQYDIAVVDTEVTVEHAADDPVTWAQPLDPYRLFQSRIVPVCAAFGKGPLSELHFALGVRAFGQSKPPHPDFLPHPFPDFQGNGTVASARRADAEIPLIRFNDFSCQARGPLVRCHALLKLAACLEK